MKDKVLYIIIGVLIGIVVMQWQQGPQPAQAQAPGIVGSMYDWPATNSHLVILENGDTYRNHLTFSPGDFWRYESTPEYLGNFFVGGLPVQTNQESWGGVKGKYKPQGE